MNRYWLHLLMLTVVASIIPVSYSSAAPTTTITNDFMPEPFRNPATACHLDRITSGSLSLFVDEDCPKCCGYLDTVGESGAALSEEEGVGVYLHSGELYYAAIDIRIPGRGIDWQFGRKYRSGLNFEGSLGFGWTTTYGDTLFLDSDTGNVEYFDTTRGRSELYRLTETPQGAVYQSPTGHYTRLQENSESAEFELYDAYGNVAIFTPFNLAGIGRLSMLRDAHGNEMTFQYNGDGQLSTVIDTLGRQIDYVYANGLLDYVEDFAARRVQFTYDGNGNLTSVTSPAVVATPNGNDFPNGRTTQYQYSGNELTAIIAPNAVADGSLTPRVQILYDEGSGQIDTLTIGNTDSSFIVSGGAIAYTYGANTTDVTDRNGNQTRYTFSVEGHVTQQAQFTRGLRNGEPVAFTTTFQHNGDGEVTEVALPEGNRITYTYDSGNIDRRAQGNVLAQAQIADDTRSGDQGTLLTTFSYEPIYNQMRTLTDARGNAVGYVPPNGGVHSTERYTTQRIFDYEESCNFAAIGAQIGLAAIETEQLLSNTGMCDVPLGDVNGDGITDQLVGNLLQNIEPTVTLLPSANLVAVEGGTSQPIETIYTYNQFGQVTQRRDPESNIIQYTYYSEQDPDGDGTINFAGGDSQTGGYLAQQAVDTTSDPTRNSGTNPVPVLSRTSYAYDTVGNLIRQVDGRGIATDYAVNALNEVVQITQAAAHNLRIPDPVEPQLLIDFQYLERIFYDHNGNIVLHQREDRLNTSDVDGNLPPSILPATAVDPDPVGGTAYIDTLFVYDALDNVVQAVEEVQNGISPNFISTLFRYDGNENRVLERQPINNAVSYQYDERDLLFQQTIGATAPAPNTVLAVGDSTTYNPRGGIPAVTTYQYDGNENLVEMVDSADTDNASANNSDIAGHGDRTRYLYDGHDRQTSQIDAVGNQSLYQYDPASNIVRELHFGLTGGVSPKDDGGDALAVPVSEEGVVQSGNLIATTLLAGSETAFDELNRPYQQDALLFINTIPIIGSPDVADGAVDLGKQNLTPNDTTAVAGVGGITLLGRVTERTEYDRLSRSVYTIEDDGDTSQQFYDGVGRIIQTTDAVGNQMQFAFDDNNNLIELLETDVATGLSNELFVTTYFYDSLNRLQQQVDNVGQSRDYRYDSRGNVVAESDGNGPLTGASITRRSFAGGTQTNNTINDPGNVTRYTYDGLDRKLQSETTLTATRQGNGSLGATLFGQKTNTLNPDFGQAGGTITIDYAYDGNSLLSSLTDDNGNQTQYTYDNLNRLLSETKGICTPNAITPQCDPPTVITYSYDPDHNVVQIVDEIGSTLIYIFDALNRPIQESIQRGTNVVGTTLVTYQYDGLSRITLATNNNEPTVTFDDSTVTQAYDSLSRLLEEQQIVGSFHAAISYDWRAANLQKAIHYPDGRTISYLYDGLDRQQAIADSSGTLASYQFIGPDRLLTRTHGNGSQLTTLNTASDTVVGYDGLRRPIAWRHQRSDASLIIGFTHTYDRADNKLTQNLLHNADNSERYQYDSANRLIDYERGTLNGSQTAIAVPSPNLLQQQAWQLDGVGNWTENQTTVGGVTDIENRDHNSFNELYHRENGSVDDYFYDDNGNVLGNTGLTYTWDAYNRLRTVSDATRAIVATYSYDAFGRRVGTNLSEIPTNVTFTNGHITPNNGLLLLALFSALTWFSWRMRRKMLILLSLLVLPSSLASVEAAAAGATRFLYDGWRVIEERDNGGALQNQFVYGGHYIDELLLIDRNLDGVGGATGADDERLTYHQNVLHSVYALTTDGEEIRSGYAYDAYGRHTLFEAGSNSTVDFGGDDEVTADGVSPNPFTFTGRRFDEESGLHYYRNRYFDSSFGRFISRDPIGNRDSLNLYQYARHAPMVNVDPTGLVVNCVSAGGSFVAGGGAAISFQHCSDECNNSAFIVAVSGKVGVDLGVGVGLGGGTGCLKEYLAPMKSNELAIDFTVGLGPFSVSFGIGSSAGSPTLTFSPISFPVALAIGAGQSIVVSENTSHECPCFSWIDFWDAEWRYDTQPYHLGYMYIRPSWDKYKVRHGGGFIAPVQVDIPCW